VLDRDTRRSAEELLALLQERDVKLLADES
jgi:hypothetical protein